MNIDIDKLKSETNGRWPGIYAALGIDVGSGEHRPCPVCSGTDRFRFTNEDGSGNWFCNGCDPKAGDGFALVGKFFGLDFIGACEKIAGVVGGCEKTHQRIETKTNVKASNASLWRTSKILNGSTPADKYLRSRGLLFGSKVIRHCGSCYCTELGREIDAMVAPVQNPDGKAVSIHRTYLTPDGQKADLNKVKMLTPVSEKIVGGAIRLHKPKNGFLGIAEGIETALSCLQLYNVPTWAAVSSTILESFTPPKDVRTVSIYADNDANFAGQKAAYRLAERLHKDGYLVEVIVPDIVGDFNDVLNHK